MKVQDQVGKCTNFFSALLGLLEFNNIMKLCIDQIVVVGKTLMC